MHPEIHIGARTSTPDPSSYSWSRYIGVFVGGLLIAAILGLLGSDREAELRAGGGVLQLLGLLTVALGISALRRNFGLGGTFAEILSESWSSLKAALGDIWHWLRPRAQD